MSTKEQIKSTIVEITQLRAVAEHLQSVEDQLDEARVEASKLDKQLAKELKDFEDLQSLSVKGLFYKVLGSKEEQLEKERQEYLKANLRYRESLKSIEILEYERDLVAKKVGNIDVLKEKLEKLKQKREQEILAGNSGEKAKLSQLYKEMDEAVQYRQETIEAFNAGKNAQEDTYKVLEYLKEAVKWGQWDMMNSKTRYYDRMKHSAIDRAMRSAIGAQKSLQIFKRELNDIGQTHNLSIHIAENGRFMDVFFDNLISDWIIQNKINNVKANVSATYDKVRLILATLEKEMQKADAYHQRLEDQRSQLLLQA